MMLDAAAGEWEAKRVVTLPSDPLLAHILACRTPRSEGRPLLFQGQTLGRVHPRIVSSFARHLPHTDFGYQITHGDTIERMGAELAAMGLYRSHDELFDVRISPDAPPIGRIDRGALPLLGLLAQGVHVNGLVERANGVHLWVGRRSPHKRLDPGKLDHLVAGGIPAGHTPAEALVKEAEEEASIPGQLAQQAIPVATLGYALERPEGARRDILHCYDLILPENFQPTPSDGEVIDFECLPLPQVLQLVEAGDSFKFNVNLVLIDLFIRRNLITGDRARLLADSMERGLALALAS